MPNAVVEVVTAASSRRVVSTLSGNESSSSFTPQLGRSMYLTLGGTWEGSVKLVRSVDKGKTWNTITKDGLPTLIFDGNCDEIVACPTDSGGIYKVIANLSSGSVSVRIAQ